MSEAPSVLVVDDSPGICQTMSMILRRKGFEVSCAVDGPEAVEKVKQRPFDVVLLDIRLPGMDGVEVQRRIRSLRPAAKVAMMTAYAVEDKVRDALSAGAETVFYKPLDMDAIINYLQKGAQAH
jgi:CheY-like chemotaxis protein